VVTRALRVLANDKAIRPPFRRNTGNSRGGLPLPQGGAASSAPTIPESGTCHITVTGCSSALPTRQGVCRATTHGRLSYTATYSRTSTWTPERTASSAAFSKCDEVSSPTYASPQLVHTSAGTLLKTSVVSSRSRVTVVLPALVSPVLQMTHFTAASFSRSPAPTHWGPARTS